MLDEIVGAIQSGGNTAQVCAYLTFYSDTVIKSNINRHAAGVPAMFYVVQSRDSSMIQLWTKYGGNVNATATFGPLTDVPLLAFAVGLDVSFKNDATDILTTLLNLGALPTSLPQAFCSPFLKALPLHGPDETEMPELAHKQTSWCIAGVRRMLAARLNLQQRYYLIMPSMLIGPGVTARQVASFAKRDNLLILPYFLIG